jgi:hypothetical protein
MMPGQGLAQQAQLARVDVLVCPPVVCACHRMAQPAPLTQQLNQSLALGIDAVAVFGGWSVAEVLHAPSVELAFEAAMGWVKKRPVQFCWPWVSI